MKITNISGRPHHVTTYKKWQYKICKLIKVEPFEKFYVEINFNADGKLNVGDFVRFNNALQSRIVEDNFGRYKCYFFTETPISGFNYTFTEVDVIGKPYAEK